MSNIASIVDVDSAIIVAQRRCEDLGVQVEFNEWAKTAYTNGSQIVLPVLRHPITIEQLELLYGYLIHETGHHLRKDAFKILANARPPEHVCALYNILEDDGMERERANEWKGDRKALSHTNNILVGKSVQQWNDADPDKKAKQDPRPVAAMTLYQLSRLDWDYLSEDTIAQFIAALPNSAQSLIEELLKEDWITRMRNGSSPQDTWNITIDLAKRLYPDNDEEEYEQIREAGLSEEDTPRDVSQDTMPDSQNQEKGDSTGEGESIGEGEQAGEDTGEEGMVISWKDAVLSEHNEWEANDESPGVIGIDWTDYQKGSVALMPTNKINVIDLSKSKSAPFGWQRYLPHNEQSRILANRMRRYIQAEARSKVSRDKYHGRLDKASIVKLALPPVDKGEYNKKIFYDLERKTMKDTCIFVLTDWSGSMMGKKMELAADASQRLVYVFERILRLPVALAAFSDGRSECDIGYIKPWNTRGMSCEEIAKRFAKFYYWTSANNDGDSVHWAWQQILKRKEHRKILIVVSDGCPAGSWKSASGHSTLQYVTKTIEQDGRVELYGVGVNSDAVSTYYTNHKVLKSADCINETLFQLVKEGNNAKSRSSTG